MSGGIGGRLSDKACKAFVAQEARGKKLPDGGGPASLYYACRWSHLAQQMMIEKLTAVITIEPAQIERQRLLNLLNLVQHLA